MSGPSRQYEKLPGRTSHVVGVARLWAHADHLLATTNYFGIENYQRYYFRDIQTLLIRRTKARMWWNVGFGSCAALGALVGGGFWFASTRVEDPSGKATLIGFAVLFGIGAAFCLICMLVNSARGATCALVAQTAAGAQSLPGTSRVRAARRTLARIAPRILEAQTSAPGPQAPA